jgi:hypothetical protein
MQPSHSPEDQRSEHTEADEPRPANEESTFELPQPRRFLSPAASWALGSLAVLLLLAGVWVLQYQRSADRDYGALALQYVQPYPKLPRWPENTDLPAPLIAGLRAFEQRQFALAANELSRVASESPQYRISRFYLGVSLLASQRFQAASDALQTAAATQDWQAREAAQYYLGVSLIGQGLPDAACTWLNPDNYRRNTRYGGQVQGLYRRFCP